MPTTDFTSGTVITSTWLDEVDAHVFERREPISVFSYLSAAQQASVLAYNFAVDVTTELQAAMDAAFAAQRRLHIPGGGYLVTGLTLPGTAALRKNGFVMYGDGTGEAFAVVQGNYGGTIIKSATDAPVLEYTPDSANTGNGQADISFITFWGDSTTPVINFGSFYSTSEFHHNTVIQMGTGNGITCALSNTIEIHHNQILNGDWNTTGLGAARTGVALYCYQTIPTGLTTIRKNTFRGFLTGCTLGDGSVAMYSPRIEACECSVTRNGFIVSAGVNSATIVANYMEGGDAGTGISLLGNYCTVSDNLIFAGYLTGIDDSAATYGNVITGNTISAASVASSKLIKLGSSGADGGPGKLCTGNTLTFSGSGGSIAGVVGITITGLDPRLDWAGNIFDPRGPWVGGAGTAKISDASTDSNGTTGNGVFGQTMVSDKGGTKELPLISRGAVNLHVDTTSLAAGNISAGVLTIGDASVFTLDLAAPTNITSIVANNLPDKTFELHVVDAQPTFVHGSLLKCKGSANYTPPAGGAWLKFQVKPGGVVWMTGWTEY